MKISLKGIFKGFSTTCGSGGINDVHQCQKIVKMPSCAMNGLHACQKHIIALECSSILRKLNSHNLNFLKFENLPSS